MRHALLPPESGPPDRLDLGTLSDFDFSWKCYHGLSHLEIKLNSYTLESTQQKILYVSRIYLFNRIFSEVRKL